MDARLHPRLVGLYEDPEALQRSDKYVIKAYKERLHDNGPQSYGSATTRSNDDSGESWSRTVSGESADPIASDSEDECGPASTPSPPPRPPRATARDHTSPEPPGARIVTVLDDPQSPAYIQLRPDASLDELIFGTKNAHGGSMSTGLSGGIRAHAMLEAAASQMNGLMPPGLERTPPTKPPSQFAQQRWHAAHSASQESIVGHVRTPLAAPPGQFVPQPRAQNYVQNADVTNAKRSTERMLQQGAAMNADAQLAAQDHPTNYRVTGPPGQRKDHWSASCRSTGTLRQHLRELSVKNVSNILIVRKIHPLGFKSPELLRAHFSQYGGVDMVRVAHSRVVTGSNTRVRPGSLGFVAMSTEAGVQAAMDAGEKQMVGAYNQTQVTLSRFENQMRFDDETTK